jgi:hypothetical protein
MLRLAGDRDTTLDIQGCQSPRFNVAPHQRIAEHIKSSKIQSSGHIIASGLEPNFGGTSFRELADRSLTMMLAVEVWESGGVRIAITFGRRRLSGFDAASCCSRR